MENTQQNRNIQQDLHRLTIDFSIIETEEVIKRLENILKEIKKQKKGVKQNG